MLAIKQAIYDYYSEAEESCVRESVEKIMYSCNTNESNDEAFENLFENLFE